LARVLSIPNTHDTTRSLAFWVESSLISRMTDSQAIAEYDAALVRLYAERADPALTNERRASIDAAIATLVLLGGSYRPAAGSPPSPIRAAAPATNAADHALGPFFGMSLKDACYKQLTLVGHKNAQTPKEIWAALAAGGYQSAHNDPSHAVLNALSRRASKRGDVLLVGGGKWGLKDWYTDAELEAIKGSIGGMPGRDTEAHRERTKSGMLLAKGNGARIGRDLFMTPERVAEAEKRLAAGESISDIAKDWNISRQTLYVRFDRNAIAKLRGEATEDERNAAIEEQAVPDTTRH